MAYRDVDQSVGQRTSDPNAAQLPIAMDRGGAASLSRHRSDVTDVRAFRDADGRPVQCDADVTCDPESCGMEDAVAVDHQDVWLRIQKCEAALDSWEFPVCEVPWDVRKSHAHLRLRGLDDLAVRQGEHNCRSGSDLSVICEVETRNRFLRRESVLRDDASREAPLFFSYALPGWRHLKIRYTAVPELD